MSIESHSSAKTQFVESNGVRFAYRKFGAVTGTPLLFFQHFRGGMDHWDPLLTDGFAKARPIILFDNIGVASTSGTTPCTVDEMADGAAAFVKALQLPKIDVLGLSIGGYVAQGFALRHPELLRHLILASTAPRTGEPPSDPRVRAVMVEPQETLKDFLYLFFAPTESSHAAGQVYWERRHRRDDADVPASGQTIQAQGAAIQDWYQPRGEYYSELKQIKHRTLVVNGSSDIICPPINSFHLQQNIPDAQLILYPDSAHGAIFQNAEVFVKHATLFLDHSNS